MLVVTRKPKQQLVLPTEGITITVLETRRGRVRLGIEAPEHVRILRTELLKASDCYIHPSHPQSQTSTNLPVSEERHHSRGACQS